MRVRASTLALAGAGIGVAAWALADYRAWRVLGPGGLPATWRGWLRTTRWRMMKRDTLALGELRAVADTATLTDLPARHGSRPKVGPHPVPHRQLTDHAPLELRLALAQRFDGRTAREPDRLVMAMSRFEKHNPAVTALPAHRHHAVACSACGEAGHVHPHDGSMHMILSPADACAVVDGRWGELHGLAGRALDLPPTYTLIYAPRDEGEAATVMRILDAAIDYMTHDPATVAA